MFRPLGMNDTHFRDDHTTLVKNRAFAYGFRQDAWQMNVPGFDVIGDGGLFTTVEDLMKWARNFDDPIVGRNVVLKSLTRGRLNSGDSIPYAFGQVHNVFRGVPTLEHGGAYGGYRTNLMRVPSQKFAVAMLCNSAAANPAALSQRVAAVLLADRLPAVAQNNTNSSAVKASTVRLTREQLDRLAGAYWDAKSEFLRRVEARDTALALTGTPVVLLPLDEDRFQANTGPARFVFTRNRNGTVLLEETSPTGDKLNYQRMPAARADARTLQEYAGDYYSDELDTTWRIEPVNGTLVIRRRTLPDLPIQPVFLDAFQSPAGVMRFMRVDGRVNGFVVGAGRVTGFRFSRR
jgi:hypothetical protein